MKRSRLLVLLAALVLGVAAPGALLAQEQPYGSEAPAAPTSSLTGTVISSSSGSIVIRSDAGVESTFSVDSSTVLPSNLQSGDRVSVDYLAMDGGAYHASRVFIVQGESDVQPASGYDAAAGTESGASGAGGDLPRTASPLPLFAAMGVLAIGAAFAVRAIFRRLRPSV